MTSPGESISAWIHVMFGGYEGPSKYSQDLEDVCRGFFLLPITGLFREYNTLYISSKDLTLRVTVQDVDGSRRRVTLTGKYSVFKDLRPVDLWQTGKDLHQASLGLMDYGELLATFEDVRPAYCTMMEIIRYADAEKRLDDGDLESIDGLNPNPGKAIAEIQRRLQ